MSDDKLHLTLFTSVHLGNTTEVFGDSSKNQTSHPLTLDLGDDFVLGFRQLNLTSPIFLKRK